MSTEGAFWQWIGVENITAILIISAVLVLFVTLLLEYAFKSKSFVKERQFDMVIDIKSILKFNLNSWIFSVRKASKIMDIIKNDTLVKSRCFIVIGPFNSGKTFLMHLLYGIKLPELGVASRTKSFSALYINDTYPTLVVDTAGIFSPCYY